MATLTPRNLYVGTPNTTRGEPTHISADPTAATDSIVYPSGLVAVIRSISSPLDARAFTLHTAFVTAAAFTPDASLVASADAHGTIRLWNPQTLVQKAEFAAMAGAVRDLAFDASAKFLVCGGDSRGGFAKVLKSPSGGSAGSCAGHTKRVIACDISSAGGVATGGEDMSLGLFKGPPVRDMQVPKFLRHHTAFINDLRFSPDGKLLAVASSDRTVSVVDAESYEVLKTLEGHAASVTGVCWAADGKTLLTSANDKTTKTWNVSDGKCVHTVTHGTDVMDMQVGCAIAGKNNEHVSVSLRAEVSVCDPEADKPKAVLRGHAKQIVGLAVVGSKMYSADYSGHMVAWEADIGSADVCFNGKGPTTALCGIAANADVVANVGQDGKIFITPTTSLTFAKPVTVKGGGVDIAVPMGSSTKISAVMVNETRLVAVNPAGTAIAAELKFGNGETGSSVAVSSDGSLIAVGMQLPGEVGELRFYSLNGSTLALTGENIRVPSPPNRVAFSPDDGLVAVGERSRRVKIYDVASRSSVTGGGIAHTARVDAICFSPDGTQVASGGMDGSVAVWLVNSEEDPVRLKMAHRNGVTGIGFTSASCVVTSGTDSCVRSWDM